MTSRISFFFIAALLLAAVPGRGAPAYGSSMGDYSARDDIGLKCVYSFPDWDERMFGSSPVTPIVVYYSSSFGDQWNSVSAPNSKLSDGQVAAVIQSAMEEWNLNSRGPLLLWGGRKTISMIGYSEVNNCSDMGSLPGRSIFIHFVPGVGNGGNAVPISAVNEPKNCGENEIALFLESGPGKNRNFHGMRANLIHEFGHALGLGHSFGQHDLNAHSRAPMAAMAYVDVGDVFYPQRRVSRFSASNVTAPQNPAAACVSNSDCQPEALCVANACVNRIYQKSIPYSSAACPSGIGNEWSCALETKRQHYNHLWPYDVDCVDDRTNGATFQDARRRRLNYYYTSLSSTQEFPFPKGIVGYQSSGATSKGFASGGRFRGTPIGSGPERPVYGAYFDNLFSNERIVTTTSLNSSGFVAWGESQDIAGVNLQHLSVAPLFTSVYEKTTLSFRSVLIHAAANRNTLANSPAANPLHDETAKADPPVIRQQRGIAIGQLSWIEDLYSCSSKVACDERLVQTHVALSSAYDPISEKTLFLTVPSRGNCTSRDNAGGLTCGRIYIHPGYASATSDASHNTHQTLAAPTKVHAVPAPAPAGAMRLPPYTGANGYSYSGRTDVGAAVACAPIVGGSNCLVAWVDNGTPDGDVIYSYFSVTGTEIDFLVGAGVMTRNDGTKISSISNLSAAFFAGRFWMSYKTLGGSDSVAGVGVISTDKVGSSVFARFNWGEKFITEDIGNIADPPTLLYDPLDENLEAVLIWTEG